MAQRTNSGQPYGDIFLVNTPALDRWGQQLYLEQKQREARAQQESAALDANIQKELGKVRSVDAPDVINSYQRYKDLKKNINYNKDLQKDTIALNQAQLAAAKAYQDIFTISKRSSELNDMQKNLTAGYMKDPNTHADDFGIKMNALMNTPISGLSQPHPQHGDLTNMEGYLDRSINTDFGKMVRDAIGKEIDIYGKPEPIDGGLQTKTPVFKYANTPLQVKDSILGTMSMRQAGKDAAKAWNQLPESEIESTIKAYQALPKEHWQKMGLMEPQNLFPKNPDSKAENFASYLAMKDAISRAPREDKPLIETNLKAVKDLDWARSLRMQEIKSADAEKLARLKKDLDPNDTELNNIWYERHLDNIIEGSKSGESRHMYKDGKSLGYYRVIKPDAFTAKAFARDIGEPDRIGVMEGTGEIIPIFYKYDDKKQVVKNSTGGSVLNEMYSQPMSYEQALINLGYRGATKKQLAKDLQGRPASKESKSNTQPKQKDPLGLF